MAMRAGLVPALMIDASHGNSGKNPGNQPLVIDDVSKQIEGGDRRIIGVMLESNLTGGRQDLLPGKPLIYGRSITDGCIDWATSVIVLERLATAVENRRRSTAIIRGRGIEHGAIRRAMRGSGV
jgi:3-deoxy-7-phosphoheptulonate synthase